MFKVGDKVLTYTGRRAVVTAADTVTGWLQLKCDDGDDNALKAHESYTRMAPLEPTPNRPAGSRPMTKHTCNGGNGPVFGRKTAGCPRCDELCNGALVVQWHGGQAKQRDAEQCRAIAAHFRSHAHRSGGCGPVCTYGDW